jgi:Amt family ammonium transporter
LLYSTFILWVGWLGFNGGSALAIARACVNTVLSSSTRGLAAVFLHKLLTGDYDLSACLNGVLGGVVSITGCCFCVEMWAALVISTVYKTCAHLLV